MGVKDADFDVVIAGGGAAGCVIAARIAEARPHWTIALVERGVDTRDTDEYDVPLVSLGQVFKSASTLKVHESPASEHLDGRKSTTACANLLGGGTLVNMMIFNTPAASDFDDWKQPGWSFDELLPYMKKVTTSHVDDPGNLYGRDGPMQISYGGFRGSLVDEFNKVVKAAGYSHKNQLFDFHTGTGYGRWIKWISSEGKRQHAAKAYLAPRGPGSFPNLEVFTETTVDKIIFDGKRATGIRICRPGDATDACTLTARKQVVLSAGALGTPAILQRSGVGPGELLTGLGIPVVGDLLGVGKEYLDHALFYIPFLAPDSAETVDPILEEDPRAVSQAMGQYEQTHDGPMADMPATGALTVHPTEEEALEIGPNFAEHWKRLRGNNTDKKLLSVYEHHNLIGDRTGVPTGAKYYSVAWQSNYPASLGHLRIQSRDPQAPLDFTDGLLSHPADMEAHIWTYKKMRSLGRQFDSFRGELAARHPAFPADSGAAIKAHDGPITEPLVYSAEDDQAIATWVRKNVGTSWHSMGTCPMKAREHGGVVDARLDVYGVKGLKVTDMSIAPSNVGANTALTALTIGEKAAALILEDLGE